VADLLIAPTATELVDRWANDFIALLAVPSERRTIALSGGKTPQFFFQRLTQEPYRSRIPWPKLFFFFVDERCVPPNHPDSNYRMVDEALFQKAPVDRAQIFRMKGELDPAAAAADYEALLRDHFSGQAWPALDLILLGMGADGHTASLFPGTAAVQENNRWVVANTAPALNSTRITLTLPVLNQGRHVWFLITGKDKAAMRRQVVTGPNPLRPASLVAPEKGELRWYADAAAAAG
jgi:6-phosphogluconolactonase